MTQATVEIATITREPLRRAHREAVTKSSHGICQEQPIRKLIRELIDSKFEPQTNEANAVNSIPLLSNGGDEDAIRCRSKD